MRFVVASAFRNASQPQIARWVSQVLALRVELRKHYYCSLRAVAVEGDSTDRTADRLACAAEAAWGSNIDLDLRYCHTGAPHYGSVEDPARMAALSKVGNAIFDAVDECDDVLIYVESDLVWDAETIAELVRLVLVEPKNSVSDEYAAPVYGSVVAPLVFAGEHMYDTWACRGLDGARFAPFSPYHSSLADRLPATAAVYPLVEVSSAGSCLVMRGEIARAVRIKDDNALVGWCAEARKQGYKVYVAPELRIRHPV